MKKAEKTVLVENLTKEITQANGVVLVNFAGLGVKTQQELKKRLKEVDAKMLVIKNTLLKRAAQEAKLPEEILSDEVLSGQTALVLANGDSLAPISVLGKFAKEFELPKMKVGVIDGAFQSEKALDALSKLPGRDALLGQVLGALMASQYGLVGTLQGNLHKLVYILKQKAG